METSKLFFDLPKHLIAQFPHQRREKSRLAMVYPDALHFATVESLIHCVPRDAYIVLNTSKVRRARIFAQGESSSKRIEFLLLTQITENKWTVLSRGAQSGKNYTLEGGLKVLYEHPYVLTQEAITEGYLERHGTVPLPPYIRRSADDHDQSRYQTIYADSLGSSAAPTAGLHISSEFLAQCAQKNITIVPVILHTGLGTFAPIKKSTIAAHTMHTEEYEISEQSAFLLNQAKQEQRNILGIGTTSLRAVESATGEEGMVHAGKQETALFITPGYRCKTITSLLTNFHTPYSTLLVLVSSLIGYEATMALYGHAVRRGIRFFSYGDTMYIDCFIKH